MDWQEGIIELSGPYIYVLEHHQYDTKLMEVIMSGTTFDECILNPSMNVMVVCPQL